MRSPHKCFNILLVMLYVVICSYVICMVSIRLQAQVDNQNRELEKRITEAKELKEAHSELQEKYNECAKPEMVQR